MSKTHLGFPYLINFSNLTQRWLTNGYVRSVRRIKQAPYPLVKVRLEEVASIPGILILFLLLFLHDFAGIYASLVKLTSIKVKGCIFFLLQNLN